MKILIADDNRLNCELIRTKLSNFSFKISESDNGFAVLEQLENEVPDLILLDINMPIMSGIDCTRVIKADNKFRHIPIVVMTADSSNREECFAAGCDEYLLKPVRSKQLLQLMAQLLSTKKAQ